MKYMVTAAGLVMTSSTWIARVAATCALFLACAGPGAALKAGNESLSRDELRRITQKLDKGQYQIASEVFMAKDDRRKKEFPIRVTYPVCGGKLPIIVFSHGNALSGNSYRYLVDCWARHGYICVQPFHEDSLEWSRYHKATLKTLDLIRSLAENKRAWLDRIGDVSFVIDKLPTLYPKLAGKLDMTKIGVGGHSYGAFTALMLAGAKVPHVELPPRCDSARDKRIKAIIAISSQGIGGAQDALAFDNKGSFSVQVPALFVTGDRDEIGGTKASQRDQAFQFSPPGDKYYLSLFGANHMTFADPERDTSIKGSILKMLFSQVNNSMLDPYGDQDAQRKLVQESTLLFWDAYVKGDADDKTLLSKGVLDSLAGKAAESIRK
jgi:predicted dienelactone hydrolase